MRKLLSVFIALGFLAPAISFAACSPVALGGTGNCFLTVADVLFGNGTSPIATSSVFTYTTAASRLAFPYASSTAQSISGSLWLTALGTPAGSLLAVDANGKVIATSTSSGVTSVTATWPVLSSGGTTPVISWDGLATSSGLGSGQVLYATGVKTLQSIATSSITFNSPLSTSGTAGALVGGTALTVSCPTCSTATGANPTGTVGLSAVNGVATTFLRSDGAPALSQAIAPTWTNLHIFSAGASSTQMSVFTKAYFGATATTSVSSTGAITVSTTDVNTFPNASTTAFSVNGDTVTGKRYITFSYATTTAWTASTTALGLGAAPVGLTLQSAQCYTDTGTLNVQFQYGTGPTLVLPMISGASTTIGTVNFTSNNTPAAGNSIKVTVGTPASTPTQISCTITAKQT